MSLFQYWRLLKRRVFMALGQAQRRKSAIKMHHNQWPSTISFPQKFQVIVNYEEMFRVFGARKQPSRTLNEKSSQECRKSNKKQLKICAIKRWYTSLECRKIRCVFLQPAYASRNILTFLNLHVNDEYQLLRKALFFYFFGSKTFLSEQGSEWPLIWEVRIVLFFWSFQRSHIPIFCFWYF